MMEAPTPEMIKQEKERQRRLAELAMENQEEDGE